MLLDKGYFKCVKTNSYKLKSIQFDVYYILYFEKRLIVKIPMTV